MRQGYWLIASSIVALVVIPISVELLIAYIKAENYSLPRAATVLTAALAVVALLLVLRRFARRLHLILELALLALGLMIFVVGAIVLAAEPRDVRTIGLVFCGLGLLIVALTAYSIYVELTGAEIYFAVPERPIGHVVQEVEESGHRILTTKFPTFHRDDEDVAQICREALHPRDVHFIGYYVDGRCRFHADVLDNPGLNRFFRGRDRTAQRSTYERAGRQLSWTMSRLDTYLRKLRSGILIRCVLDVEQGALYYYWIGENAYLTGVTMDQSQVLHTDEKLRRLANQIGVLPRGGTLGLPRISQAVVEDQA
jgi:hypothetical protein